MSYLDQITVGSTTYDLQDSGAQRVTLTGTSAPTTSTVGVVGQHYINTSATSHPYEYVCTAVSSGTYTWIPVDSSEAPVTSVNSKTGAVVLDKTDIGLGNVANVAQYSASNPPPYPVTSVNGSTGAVTVNVPSAATATPSNLGTAAVGTSTKYAKEDHVHKMPTASDVGALPSSTSIPSKTSDLTNDSGFITSSSVPVAATETPSDLGTATIGTSVKYAREDHVHTKPTYSKSDVGLGSVDNVKQYSASNPPPYPVTSVNGNTGAVTVVEDDKTWNGVSLAKQSATNTGDSTYVPLATSLTPVNMSFTPVKKTPTANAIAKYDNNSYLYSTTPSANDNSTKVATTAYVDSAIDDLPEPMVFKGSLGTGGTITTLPAAASSNTGFTYKVITDGTYASQDAKVGDTFISDGTAWVLIPSGDEPSGTVTSVGVSNATNGGLSVSGSPITSSGSITIGHSNVLSSAQTTQAVYPIKIDKNGHISAYGSAVSIPSKTSDLTNDSGFITAASVPAAATETPEDLGTAAIGTSTKYAREDHVHTKPTYSKSDVGLGNVDNVKQYSASNPPPYPVTSVNGSTGAVTVNVPSASSTTPANLAATAAVGTGTTWARSDHIHKMPSASDVGALPSSTVIPSASSATPQALGTAAAGTSTDYSRADHVHAKPTYSKSDVGLGNVDNVKQYSASNPPPYPVTSVNGSTGAVTVAVPSAATATPSNLGTAAIGTSTKYAKEDHVHNYPDVVYVGSSAPTDTNIELWLDSNSGGSSVVSSVDGKTGVVTVLPSGGTTGQVLKKVSGTSYDVTWADESGSVTSVDGKTGVVNVLPTGGAAGKVLKKKTSNNYDVEWSDDSGGVTSVNGMTGDVTVPTVAVQDTTPTETNCRFWVDTDDSGTPYSIPEIDDSSVSLVDTWSSSKIRDFIYPVGAVYISVNNVSPETIFGGTWEQIQDTFLLAAGSTYTAGNTGGEATHTLTTDEIPAHTHGSKTLTGTMNPLAWATSASESGIVSGTQLHVDRVGNSGSNWGDRQYTINATHEHDSVGGGQAHNNMPPYLVVYMWKRTA